MQNVRSWRIAQFRWGKQVLSPFEVPDGITQQDQPSRPRNVRQPFKRHIDRFFRAQLVDLPGTNSTRRKLAPDDSLKSWEITPADNAPPSAPRQLRPASGLCAGPSARPRSGLRLGHPGRIPPSTRDLRRPAAAYGGTSVRTSGENSAKNVPHRTPCTERPAQNAGPSAGPATGQLATHNGGPGPATGAGSSIARGYGAE